MADRLLYYVGDRNPSITETITVDGTAVNLTGLSAKFKMRAVGSSTLKVNAAVSNTLDSTGVVRYDWLAIDVDTEGEYICWWEITTSSKVQAMHEAVIEFRNHASLTNVYVEIEQFKATSDLTGFTFADGDIRAALLAASRWVDWECGRRFYADSDATSIRYFQPVSSDVIHVDDLITLTTLATDQDGDGTYEQSWTVNTDFVLEPLNAASEGWPYTQMRRQSRMTTGFPTSVPRSAKVTGKFGWTAVPDPISKACGLVAGKILKRSREDPGGSAEALALGGASVKLAGSDPLVRGLMAPYIRYRTGY